MSSLARLGGCPCYVAESSRMPEIQDNYCLDCLTEAKFSIMYAVSHEDSTHSRPPFLNIDGGRVVV